MKKNKKILLAISIISVIGMISAHVLSIREKREEFVEDKKEFIAMYIQDENGDYSASTTKTFPKTGYILNKEKSKCKNGGILSQDPATKKINLSVNHSDQCTLYFDKEIPSLKEFYDSVTKKSEVPNFANPATTDETADGLFSMQDDYGMSYYFRGTAPNNFVKFGRDANGQDMWWRIIRFNGDGSARMIYEGVGAAGSNTYTQKPVPRNRWNRALDAKYVGWMYGGASGSASTSKDQAQRNETDSDLKIAVDAWYKTNIVDTGFHNYVADAIFCNDRSISNEIGTGLGYGKNYTVFGGYIRLDALNTPNYKNPQPQFTCPQDNDKFTVSTTSGGNGTLTYPIGLITVDEMVTAGAGLSNKTNGTFYLYRYEDRYENMYWSFTPFNSSEDDTTMFILDSLGYISWEYVQTPKEIYPVINLKSEYLNQFKGMGTISNPYSLR